MDKKAMYKLSYGLFVLTSGMDGEDSGCIINTAQQVTSEPNRISIAVNQANFTHDLVKKSGKFNISIISQAAEFALFKHFGFQSGRDVKPKPAQTASTGKTVWRCTVCGYIYEGEELPADYICPLCKHPASDFEKVTQ